MSEAVLIRDDGRRWVDVGESARVRRATALMQAAEIDTVMSVEQQDMAVLAQQSLAQLRLDTERDRKECKAPVVDFGKAIDGAATRFIEKVAAEELRISALIADFVALQKAQIRSAEASHNESLTELERERESALATATSLEDRDQIYADFGNRIRDLGPAPEIPKADGQVITQDWTLELMNPRLFAQMHPDVATIGMKVREIKEGLRAGKTYTGIVATPIIKSGVRKGKHDIQ